MSASDLPVVKKFIERYSYWAGKGYRGQELYEKLAADSELPALFSPAEAAEIRGVGLAAMKQRRQRGEPPSYARTGHRSVHYPRPDFCDFLASELVSTK